MTKVSIQRLALPILLAFLVACSGRSGVISGELVAVGGPANVRMRLPGIVRISGGGDHLTYRIAAAADGSFSAEVRAGTYVVTGRSPLYQHGRLDCRIAQPSLTVHAHETITVDVSCDMK
jgi:hypothetical protein